VPLLEQELFTFTREERKQNSFKDSEPHAPLSLDKVDVAYDRLFVVPLASNTTIVNRNRNSFIYKYGMSTVD
jgi:hypothetical protein